MPERRPAVKLILTENMDEIIRLVQFERGYGSKSETIRHMLMESEAVLDAADELGVDLAAEHIHWGGLRENNVWLKAKEEAEREATQPFPAVVKPALGIDDFTSFDEDDDYVQAL